MHLLIQRDDEKKNFQYIFVTVPMYIYW